MNLSFPLMRRLKEPGVIMGECLECRGGVKYIEETMDYARITSIGLGCRCGGASVVEFQNKISEDDLRFGMEKKYARLRFRIKMLDWQWQTGRTLAGYWRR